jgi:dihydroneopterin aldolase
MVTIALHGAEFFARHGYYPEEQILGNRFIVDIEVSYDNDLSDQSDNLEDTVNYEQLRHSTNNDVTYQKIAGNGSSIHG